MAILGTVARLWRYPVKSMLGETCDLLQVDARGALGDRLFAVRDLDGKLGSGKTTRRFRHIDGLFRFRSVHRDDGPEVTFPDGRVMSGFDPGIHAALSAVLDRQVLLAREGCTPHLDAGPVHLLSSGSLAWLRHELPGAGLDERRFRPNLVVDTASDVPIEQAWIGETLQIGEVQLRITAPTERCAMIGMAQSELPADPSILRFVAQHAKLHVGVYAAVVVPGKLRVGDDVVSPPTRLRE